MQIGSATERCVGVIRQARQCSGSRRPPQSYWLGVNSFATGGGMPSAACRPSLKIKEKKGNLELLGFSAARKMVFQ